MEFVAEQIKEILESLPGTPEAEFGTQGRTPRPEICPGPHGSSPVERAQG
jgi:hypothetical protein